MTAEEVAKDVEIRRRVEEEFPPAPPSSRAGTGTLSKALREAIRSSDKSVYQIAKAANVRRLSSRVSVGRARYSHGDCDRLAEALGLKLETG